MLARPGIGNTLYMTQNILSQIYQPLRKTFRIGREPNLQGGMAIPGKNEASGEARVKPRL